MSISISISESYVLKEKAKIQICHRTLEMHLAHLFDSSTVCQSLIRNDLTGRVTVKKPFLMKKNDPFYTFNET